MRRTLLAPLIITLAVTAVAGGVHAGVVRNDEPTVRADQQSLQYHYAGGPQTLPYGMDDARAVLEHARSAMPIVAYAIAQLEARGYIRRPDLDASATADGFSVAAIAFEKPGQDPARRQPGLFVVTHSFDIPFVGWRPATQVYGAMFVDSAGTQYADTTTDPAIGFLGDVTPANVAIASYLSGGNGTANTDENLAMRYSAYEAHGTWQYHNTTSPGMQYLMSMAFQATAAGALAGMATGALGFRAGLGPGVLSTAVSTYVGGVYAWHRFWLSPPDTSWIVRR